MSTTVVRRSATCYELHTISVSISDRKRLWGLRSEPYDSVCLSVCLWFCPHDKTKTAETKIVKLGTEIVHHDTSSTNEY